MWLPLVSSLGLGTLLFARPVMPLALPHLLFSASLVPSRLFVIKRTVSLYAALCSAGLQSRPLAPLSADDDPSIILRIDDWGDEPTGRFYLIQWSDQTHVHEWVHRDRLLHQAPGLLQSDTLHSLSPPPEPLTRLDPSDLSSGGGQV